MYAAEVDSIIHPVSAEYMIETLAEADRTGATLVVFTLRTPGGLVDSTRDIVSRMIAATTPVAIFIGPSGSRAASAGFLLTIAADIAAMAPGTHIGAAHPVAGAGEQMTETTAKKAEEDVAAYARTLASARHRNVELASEAVRNSRAFTETEALNASPPLIDLIASDVPDLLRKLDGRTIRRFDGRTVVLRTDGARVVPIAMSLRQRVLSAIAHPNVAYLLLSLGMLGLTIELWSPGAILPGVVGGVSLLLASFALQLLPVNYAGLLLILLGLLLFALEIKVTSYGLLTAGGLISLVFGSMILMDTRAPELQVSLRVVLPVVLGFVEHRHAAREARPRRPAAPRGDRRRRDGRTDRAGPDGHRTWPDRPCRCARRDLAGDRGRRDSARGAGSHHARRRVDVDRPQRLRFRHGQYLPALVIVFIVVALSHQLDQDPGRVRAGGDLPPR